MNRIRLKIVGQSGSGLLTVGDIVSQGLNQLGFQLCSDREYPSLIKGGHSCYTINFANHPIRSLSHTADILVAIDKPSLVAYHQALKPKGTLIHGYERTQGIKDILDQAKKKNITIISTKARQLAHTYGGNELMANVILTGMVWKALGFELKIVQKLFEKKFQRKPEISKIAIKCLKAAFNEVKKISDIPLPTKKKTRKLLDGNHSLALGAVHAGVRFYVAYPMSPSSSILTHMANMSTKTGVIVKQAEDEITVAQLALGAIHGGTRALCATSGGGFDLMTETVSLAGIIETPLVIIIVQRPGPGTGLPTWTAQGDLNLAIHAGHGEFTRLVIGVSDPVDTYNNIQHALNYAEKYQIPVILLSDKVTAESKHTIDPKDFESIAIERNLTEGKDLKKLASSDRYALTKSGVSKRWLPGSCKTWYFANSDEHKEDGVLTEEGEEAGKMYAKRNRKLETLLEELPEPTLYGDIKADISFIGWGSTRTTMLDIIEFYKDKNISVNYLHYDYLWPLKTKMFEKVHKNNANIHLIEGNYLGQLGNLLEQKTGLKLKQKFLKYDGRPFFIEDVIEYIDKHTKS